MKIIRWAARIFGTLLVLTCVFVFVGTIIAGSENPNKGLETYNIITFSVLGVGLAGLVFAWWKEGLGGIISFICFVVFNLLAVFSPIEGSGYGIIFLIFLVPSLLYLLYWWLKRSR